MKIKSFEINNYTCFDKISFDLDERLTVFVGANGSGKTSILNAISAYSSFYEYGSGSSINKIMTMSMAKEKKGSKISAFCSLVSNDFASDFHADTKVYKNNILKSFTITPECVESKINKLLTSSHRCSFAYYTSKRVLPDNVSIKVSHNKVSVQSAFTNNTSPQIDFEASAGWFLQKDNEEARIIRDRGDLNYKIPELQAVRDAISQALEDYTNPRMLGTPPELVVYKAEDKNFEQPFTVNQLSDGYRTMLALIIDLARRMAVVNVETVFEEGKSVLDSNALVLIDEIELHLHPSWQQKVLPSLLKIFPNAQFVVTTHSPQVISSIEPKHLRILKDNQVVSTEANTYGAESIRILNEIFGVPARSPITEAKKNLDKYLELVNDNQYNSKEALSLRESLDVWLGNDPILETADFMINQKEREASRA